MKYFFNVHISLIDTVTMATFHTYIKFYKNSGLRDLIINPGFNTIKENSTKPL